MQGQFSTLVLACSFTRLLERRRSNLCNAALDRKQQGVIKAEREKQESSTCGTIRMNNL